MGTLQPTIGGHPRTPPAAVRFFKDALTSHPTSATHDRLFVPITPNPTLDWPQKDMHKGYPAITFTKQHVTGLSQNFQCALIDKLSQGYNKTNPCLGQSPVDQLQKYFDALDFRGTFQLGLMDNRHLLIQFQLQEDFVRMYSRLVWYIKGIPLWIFKWTSQFHVDRQSSLTPVWISLPRLLVHFFERHDLFAIATLVGVPLRMNSVIASLKRPIMVMIQVELDLLKERPLKI